MISTPVQAGSEIVLQYNPRGASAELFLRQDPQLLISGPAGTGKSRAILEKVHYACLKYPNIRALMVRKTRRSLTESGMVTYWDKVYPYLDGVRFKSAVQQYQYRNGSILAVGGLDKPSKIMSSEWDLIYVQEATELNEDDWEACTVRLRNSKMPYQQLIADCNPDAPTHWLRQRVSDGKTAMLESRHEDNPVLFDEHGNITTEGHRYMEVLDSLSGVRLARYRYGIWAASEGGVYQDSWDASKNLIDRFNVPRDWPRYLSIDFGFTNPFVCLWWARDPDGRLYCYREIYMTKRLVEDHAIDILLASGWYHLLPKTHPKYNNNPATWADPMPRDVICDTDAEDRHTLERHLGLYTTAAKKTVSDGIQAVASRLKPAGDGKPRLYYLRDSLIERDRDLAARKKPTCTVEEYDSYVWKETPAGIKEEPVKENDHGMDSTRYGCAYFDLIPNTVQYFKNIWS